MEEKILEIIEEEGLDHKIKDRTIHTTCPSCGKSDKLSILKENGATICYRGSCQFKGKFHDWLAMTANISPKEAKARIYGERRISDDLPEIQVKPEISSTEEEIEYPMSDCVSIDSEYDPGGLKYLESRGVPMQLAQVYGITYSPSKRRVIFPIMRGSKCYGYQARAIDPVDSKDRMRNNPGFKRGASIMFENRLIGCNHVIIAEGPFSAIKFHPVGGNIATMGKVVTQTQLEIIKSYSPKRIYLALDDDALLETRTIFRKFSGEVYKVNVPQKVVLRCNAEGKKADFGECTFDECIQAINEAEQMDETYLW